MARVISRIPKFTCRTPGKAKWTQKPVWGSSRGQRLARASVVHAIAWACRATVHHHCAISQKEASFIARTPDDVRKLAKEAGVKILELRFVDLPGVWQHFSLPVQDLNDDLFSDGIGFDGSSIRGFQLIHESDMLLVCDPETAYVDPMLESPTLSLICNVLDPITRQRYSRDPRYIAQKAETYLKSLGLADLSYWGPELEF